jgi:hypothetical protein
MLERIRETIIGKLALYAVARASGAGALGTTALDNEPRYYSVEYEAIIETLMSC